MRDQEPQSPKRPIWWSRHDLRPFTLSDEEAWELITSPPWRCVIAWVTRENQPVVAPMSGTPRDLSIAWGPRMLTTTKNRDKVKAFRRNPAISLCFQNAEGSKHVTVRGRLDSDDPELIRRWITSFVDSYGHHLSLEEKQLEIARYSSPDRLILIVTVEKLLTFDRERMIRAERENLDLWET